MGLEIIGNSPHLQTLLSAERRCYVEWICNANVGRLTFTGRWSHLATARFYAVERQELLATTVMSPYAKQVLSWWVARLPRHLQRLK